MKYKFIVVLWFVVIETFQVVTLELANKLAGGHNFAKTHDFRLKASI
jgi:hypothetical protein